MTRVDKREALAALYDGLRGDGFPEGVQRSTVLGTLSPPDSGEWTAITEGGSMVGCDSCGHDWMAARREKVWSYEVDARGYGIWIRATCNVCGNSEVFETFGGNKATYKREFRDLDRKHRDAKSLASRRTT